MREFINGSLSNMKIILILEDISFIVMIAPHKERKGRKEGGKKRENEWGRKEGGGVKK